MTTPTTPSAYAEYAARGAENYERHFVPAIGEPVARRLLETARPSPGERVLDVACGTGIASRLAAEAVGPDGSVSGLDANPGMLQVARTVVPDGVEWHEGDAEDVPFAEASFDLVLCSIGLQFFADKEKAAAEMGRVLAPGGRAVWCTPGPTPPMFQAIDGVLVDHLGPGASMFVHAVFAFHDPAEARWLMEGAGFDPVSTETVTLPMRVDPPAEFFWQYVNSTPLAAATAELGDRERAALEADVVERCLPFVDDGRSILDTDLLITAAHREGR